MSSSQGLARRQGAEAHAHKQRPLSFPLPRHSSFHVAQTIYWVPYVWGTEATAVIKTQFFYIFKNGHFYVVYHNLIFFSKDLVLAIKDFKIQREDRYKAVLMQGSPVVRQGKPENPEPTWVKKTCASLTCSPHPFAALWAKLHWTKNLLPPHPSGCKIAPSYCPEMTVSLL